MRVTQGMMNTQMMTNLRANNARMMKYEDMLASGKRLNRPSDDPIGVGYAMRYHAQIARNNQYQEAVDDGQSHLDFLDTTLNQANQILSRARDLAVRASTGSMSVGDRQTVANEIDQLYQQLTETGNTSFNGRYIFNGQMTDVKPYSTTPEAEGTDSGEINFMMSEGVSIPVNVIGQDVFGDPATAATLDTSDNAFAILKSLKNALNSDNQTIIGASVQRLDVRLEKVQAVWADVGARANRVELLSNRLKDFDLNLNELLSKTEDADIPETIMNMQMAENVQRASLSTGSRIIQPTLVDFLR
ncbi:MAG: flagellar hook-associated protein FlgL [Tumebacillaceae bacterium]